MNFKSYKELINRMEQNIYQLKKISFMSFNIYEKMFYDSLIKEERYRIKVLKNFMYNINEMDNIYRKNENMRQQSFTLEELLKYDGKNGNKAYVAIDGVVYDVTYNAAWAAGTHFGLKAGRDLTKEINACHNKEQILKGLEQVGILKTEGSSENAQ
ncbi:hypothetical protein GCM10008905_09830 [Clostridium malenominatum]|uniref:Cytochrome b5 heme-binding domain-containing protein n=1 Tax=Clostridium malenominatum TaxID=1539 RepID=A0ABN1IST0_9CLOT